MKRNRYEGNDKKTIQEKRILYKHTHVIIQTMKCRTKHAKCNMCIIQLIHTIYFSCEEQTLNSHIVYINLFSAIFIEKSLFPNKN